MRKILHISVRLSEGGAALVARTLVDEQRASGAGSRFAYGYGPSGRDSPLEAEYGAVSLSSRSRAASNMVAHSILGSEIFGVRPASRAAFDNDLRWADVVHLHVVHSYFVQPTKLIERLANLGKPVVWTLHDQWIMTGRCAQPGSCEGWRTGCGNCPQMAAYPPGRVDRSARIWKARRDAVERLTASTPVAIVACAEWLGEAARDAGIPNVRVIKNSVDGAFWGALEAQRGEIARSRRALFMCRDLRDDGKVDWALLAKVGELVPLTIVGDNPPSSQITADILPAIADRARIAALMLAHDSLVFTSQVDYFPLTVVEALAAGMRVHALDSAAAREFHGHDAMSIYSDRESLVRGVNDDTPRGLVETSTEDVQPGVMAEKYSVLYEELLGT